MIFTIGFAGFVLHERPRREQVGGRRVAFAGLAVIGIDRAASAPILPFVLILGAAAAWGVTNVMTRMAQPPDPLAMLVWASLVPPLPLLGLSLAFEGPAEIGDALAGIDAAAVGALPFVALVGGLFGFAAWTTLLKRHTAAAVTPFALLVPVFGIASAALFLGERPERAGARRRRAHLRRPGGDAQARARPRPRGTTVCGRCCVDREWRRGTASVQGMHQHARRIPLAAAIAGGRRRTARATQPSRSRTSRSRPPRSRVTQGDEGHLGLRDAAAHNVAVASGPVKFHSRTRPGTLQDEAQAGRDLRLYCSIHPDMRQTITVR